MKKYTITNKTDLDETLLFELVSRALNVRKNCTFIMHVDEEEVKVYVTIEERPNETTLCMEIVGKPVPFDIFE